VKGGHYPVPPLQQFYGELLQYAQLFLFATTFVGDGLCDSLGVAQPTILKALTQNKMGSFMFVWLFGNMVTSSFVNTQAFEIYHHKTLVWSSLSEKRMPNYNDIISGFKKSGVEVMGSSTGN